jgi:Ran GTPase-activating protein (RanGAP) involved in mRNA processing and transport
MHSESSLAGLRKMSELLSAQGRACKSLTRLSLASNRLGDEGLDALTSAFVGGLERGGGASLLVLELGGNRITNVGARLFAGRFCDDRTIRHIDLSNNRIGGEGVKYLDLMFDYVSLKVIHSVLSLK